MAENNKIDAKELYLWKQGMDDYNIKILSALNSIIDGLAALEDGDWEIISETVGSPSTCSIAEKCGKIYSSGEIADMTDNFEAIRSLIFGNKIDYSKLLDMLRENVDECGLTEEKEKQRIKQKAREYCERKAAKKKCGEFSNEMPECIKKQQDEFNRSEDGKELAQLLDENKNPSSDENTKEDNNAV